MEKQILMKSGLPVLQFLLHVSGRPVAAKRAVFTGLCHPTETPALFIRERYHLDEIRLNLFAHSLHKHNINFHLKSHYGCSFTFCDLGLQKKPSVFAFSSSSISKIRFFTIPQLE